MDRQEKYTGKELIIHRKTMELHSLRNRIKRYWKKLATESIKIAKEKGIESEIIDLGNLNETIFLPVGSKTIPIYKDGEAIDEDILLKLAKPKFPVLYRKYYEGKEKFGKGYDELKELYSELNKR